MDRRVKALCFTAMSAVLLALSAWIAVPTVPPFTLQTLVIPVVATVFGRKIGVSAAGLYLLLGAVGLPVFAGFTGGIGVLLGPTGGYLLGFLPMAWFCGSQNPQRGRCLGSWGAGWLACYAVGTLWYASVYLPFCKASLFTAFTACVLPYLLPDAAKFAVAWMISRRVKARISL